MTSLTLLPVKSKPGSVPMALESVQIILGKMHARYGVKWADMWRGVPAELLAQEWAEGLAGYTVREIERGLAARPVWPPTLPEFQVACRPPIDPEVAYHEAAAGLRARAARSAFRWTHPAIYWAAVEFGGDLGTVPWKLAAARWARILTRQMERDTWALVPELPAALLPPPPKTPCPPETRAKLADWLKQTTGGSRRRPHNAAA